MVRVMSWSRQEEIGFRTQRERLALDENKGPLFIVERNADRATSTDDAFDSVWL